MTESRTEQHRHSMCEPSAGGSVEGAPPVYTQEESRRYLCTMEQLAYARASELTDGAGRGNRIIDLCNGSGLQVTVVPDRGLDLVEASFTGVPVAFRAPAGHVAPGQEAPVGYNWLRGWAGGLLTTCGLRHVGPPVADPEKVLEPQQGLHGRISQCPAEDVSVWRGWRDGRYEIAVSGTMREAMMFGENLRLRRTISVAHGENRIRLHDVVCNEGVRPEPLQLLYHCNFGFPAIAPDTVLWPTGQRVHPRADTPPAAVAQAHTLAKPQPGIPEECFLHEIPPAEDGWAAIGFHTPSSGMAGAVRYQAGTLPFCLQWKLMEEGRYALGLEPSNTAPAGTIEASALVLQPGAQADYRIELVFGRC